MRRALLFGVIMLFALSLPLQAQDQADDLFTRGYSEYDNENWVEAAMYLFAYLQLRSNISDQAKQEIERDIEKAKENARKCPPCECPPIPQQEVGEIDSSIIGNEEILEYWYKQQQPFVNNPLSEEVPIPYEPPGNNILPLPQGD
jgi:hypothetical protein